MTASLARYESFLLKNVSTISTLESSLRTLTWLLPGRFKDAELASEALSASLNMMSMYHDTLLARIVQSDPKYRPLIPFSLHTRFTKAWADKDSRYKWAARLLETIRFTELLIEMGMRRKVSAKNRYRGIIILEVIKAILRFMLLRITRRTTISPPIPERDIDPTTLPPSTESSPTLAPSSPPSSLPATPEHLKNNRVPLPQHSPSVVPPPPRSDVSIQEYLLPKALTTTSVKPPLSLVRSFSSPQDWISEVIYILRPLVYATMLFSDRRSNRPLIAVLALEFISRSLRRNAPPSASLERSEHARRDRDLLWYLLRGTIWQSYTRPKIASLAENFSTTPILGLFGTLIQDWIPLIDEYHYYTAP
ncbi:peroxisomal membrane protein PEX16 [Lentinula aciculospora]|uniref:Peroxisomal membrane protein PEX16 n=1 Tax=Lentinula aciculospora TaxID=153920 RepID=A0A9W9DU01_9AGAR|nr:peroxisomal membrane protein PEX16 [Lentinula aciculospora]